jgi:hypothetical protein
MAQNKGIISDNAQYMEQTVPCKGNNVIPLLTMSDIICNAQYMKRYRVACWLGAVRSPPSYSAGTR